MRAISGQRGDVLLGFEDVDGEERGREVTLPMVTSGSSVVAVVSATARHPGSWHALEREILDGREPRLGGKPDAARFGFERGSAGWAGASSTAARGATSQVERLKLVWRVSRLSRELDLSSRRAAMPGCGLLTGAPWIGVCSGSACVPGSAHRTARRSGTGCGRLERGSSAAICSMMIVSSVALTPEPLRGFSGGLVAFSTRRVVNRALDARCRLLELAHPARTRRARSQLRLRLLFLRHLFITCSHQPISLAHEPDHALRCP